MTTISSKYFTRHENTLVTDISDLEANIENNYTVSLMTLFMGTGLSIRSARTGEVVRFSYDTTERDREGDVIAWHFKPHNPAEACGIAKVAILND